MENLDLDIDNYNIKDLEIFLNYLKDKNTLLMRLNQKKTKYDLNY